MCEYCVFGVRYNHTQTPCEAFGSSWHDFWQEVSGLCCSNQNTSESLAPTGCCLPPNRNQTTLALKLLEKPCMQSLFSSSVNCILKKNILQHRSSQSPAYLLATRLQAASGDTCMLSTDRNLFGHAVTLCQNRARRRISWNLSRVS